MKKVPVIPIAFLFLTVAVLLWTAGVIDGWGAWLVFRLALAAVCVYVSVEWLVLAFQPRRSAVPPKPDLSEAAALLERAGEQLKRVEQLRSTWEALDKARALAGGEPAVVVGLAGERIEKWDPVRLGADGKVYRVVPTPPAPAGPEEN